MKKGFFLLFAVCITALIAEEWELNEARQQFYEMAWEFENNAHYVDRAMAMFDLAVEVKPKVCVEIGVLEGHTIVPVTYAFQYLGQPGVIYAIDPWDVKYCQEHWSEDDSNFYTWARVDMEQIYQGFLQLLKDCDAEKYCIVLRESSATAHSKVDEIDILNIDGNHSETSMTLDTLLYVPKVKIGGYIWFDDVGWTDQKGNSCSAKALEYLSKKCIKIKEVRGSYLFKKIRH